ncbi:MAG: hypothetical protein C4B55_04010 [Candidatus Methanophagaceae archaeon]|nr:MAG: hypothetical protein C4B55_04010 [Methanophagales archaeon]
MKTKKNLKFLLLPATLLLLILILIMQNIGFSSLYSTIARANPRYLFLAVALHASSILVRNLKWQIFVNGIKRAPFFSLLAILLAGSFMDTATPGPQVGGGPLKAYFLSKKIKEDKATCLSTILVERVTGVGVLSFLGVCSIFFVLVFVQNVPLLVKVLLEFVLVLLVGLPLLGFVVKEKYEKNERKKNEGEGFKGKVIISKIYYFGPFSFLRQRFKTLQGFDGYVRQKLGEFAQTFSRLSHDKKKVSENIILAFLGWLLTFASSFVLFLALGHRPSFFAVVVVISLSIFLSYFLFMPGGAGVTELLMISLYISFGISATIAASVALLDRFIFYLFSLGFGYVSLLYLNFRYGRFN